MAQLPDGDQAPADGSLPESALASTAPLSLYVHVPFCRTRCGYCDFNTYTASELGDLSPDTYLGAAHAELALAERILGDSRPVQTVFFGGGTPTMLPAEALTGLLRAIDDRFGLAPDAEVTTEANPDTLSPAYLETLRAGGFTRLSLGFQSVVPHVLQVLERTHTPRRGLDAAQWARDAGFDHISLDLIYGTPGESMDDWRASLDAVTATPVDHVSAYSLIVEEGTRLAMQVRRGDIPMPDDDDLADKYLVADETLTALGLANYEVSNWGRPGGECRHNLAYWRGADWWGIGPGAHSHVGGVRFWNRKHPRSYAASLTAGESPALAREVLTDEDRRVERVLLELRLAGGLPLEVLRPTELARVPAVVAANLATDDGARLRLTQAGRLLADGVIRDLLD
ncbi:coproporphyrinogen III oxidase [Tessaracoccus sp. MC1865]|uniref:radical SAM family heme chaperone HemW n=1 Tax=Tessaracoccus sp. MC1865 TaxID=2760310 RepID=UPI001602D3B4|nr:radical SAM family heme chaperone HemW [Tessaracoccus sp. MC1865]MBB1484796.1 coproporphyrinogen III oxidase [Tessaracoccus sp. MC1865]QTO38801.1 coproporphyrinogen III oxidase [Tessaracoccus sp. MC1865]